MRGLFAVVALSLTLGACSGGPDPKPDASPVSSTVPAGTAQGCGQVPGDLKGGVRDVQRTIDVGGTKRSYVVHVPPGYDGSKPLPVVYLFHGLGGTSLQIMAYSGFGAKADDRDFLVVAPQAQAQAQDQRAQWDLDAKVDQPRSDAAFWLALTQQLGQEWCVDSGRQFAAGLSNGSEAVFTMACSGAFPFKAYGGVSATLYDERCSKVPPTSIVYFHGTADRSVPFDGGRTAVYVALPVPEVMADWAKHDGCAPEPQVTTIGTDVKRKQWKDCDDGSRLVNYVVEGGGHTWPGAFPFPPLGKTTTSVSATDVMVDFFGL